MNKNRAETKAERKQRLLNRKRRIQYRMRDRFWTDQANPVFAAGNIRYELTERLRALDPSGIGGRHSPVRRTGLVEAIGR